ncbi:hypothetical protein BDV96DRAFT_502229 [Lophiotrema nucula]|uniref:FAD dependent oxidoreductase domain-containing protein n=1 Tax=Lophiotrema nucula TaxID=690887 RepID=A0A6A5YQX4_9PLEO|nr:hypothetical protein BDV96DRAFT_502229 [Lophiotrema nucula]
MSCTRAGVIGLQTSIFLRQAGYDVVILAKHFPGDKSIEYTSPWAGAHWRSHASKTDFEQQSWDTETYKHMLYIIEQESVGSGACPRSGLALRNASTEAPWYSTMVLDYEDVPNSSLEQGIYHGHTYTSIMINAPMYLNYLLEHARQLGVHVIEGELPSCSNIRDRNRRPVSAFVNATGISALDFVPDPNIYPTRGQTVTVAGQAKQITTIEADSSHHGTATPIMYILPRPDSNLTILGGTKDVGNWSQDPDPEVTWEILRRAKQWAPELLNAQGEFDVRSVQVGLRPSRKGGVRVEVEGIDGLVVCHAYGHAGAGYQNSVGSANKVVQLLLNQFATAGTVSKV